MIYLWNYKTPDGFDNMQMSSDGTYLTGLWFEGSKDTGKHQRQGEVQLLPVFKETIRWLDIYFTRQEPDFTPACSIGNLTHFRKEVQSVMREIPYGKSITYGDIARVIAENRGIEKMSAQAVGGAVGSNPICIIVPCHRVMGADGSITGYGGGCDNKKALLKLEGIPYKD